jgi:hypothetical protein
VAGPEYGPGGYLPPKAAKRARKIVLREQMGWGWPLAAVAASLLVAVAGGIYLLTANRPPQAPYAAVGALADVPPDGAGVLEQGDLTALVVRAGGAVRVFRSPSVPVRWCATSGRLEGDGGVWTREGSRTYGDGPSLTPLRFVVFDGTVYVDPTDALPPPANRPDGAGPSCTDATEEVAVP